VHYRHVVERVHRKKKKLKIVFTISIDGPPSLHDEIRGSEGAWRRATETFMQLKGMQGVKAQIGFTISMHNLGRFQEFLASLRNVYPKLRLDDITVNIFQKSGFYYENLKMQDLDFSRLEEEIRRIRSMDNDTFTLNNFLRRVYLKHYPRYMRTKKSPFRCQAFSSTCFLDPYGNLFPCGVYNRKLVNIKDTEEGLGHIWNTQEAKKLSWECSHNVCPVCWSPCDAYSAVGGSLLQALLRKR
jgi:radical SAM protein with 4Fe4S-binding SPASM domain